MVLCCLADGVSEIRENIFENRFQHVAELQRMGADIHVKDRIAIVRIGTPLGCLIVRSPPVRRQLEKLQRW